MRKKTKTRRDSDMLSEYDFAKARRGKYARRYASGTNLVVLARDAAKVFPDSQSVNEALRALARISQRNAKKTSA
jgi:hypothetical protein